MAELVYFGGKIIVVSHSYVRGGACHMGIQYSFVLVKGKRLRFPFLEKQFSDKWVNKTHIWNFY